MACPPVMLIKCIVMKSYPGNIHEVQYVRSFPPFDFRSCFAWNLLHNKQVRGEDGVGRGASWWSALSSGPLSFFSKAHLKSAKNACFQESLRGTLWCWLDTTKKGKDTILLSMKKKAATSRKRRENHRHLNPKHWPPDPSTPLHLNHFFFYFYLYFYFWFFVFSFTLSYFLRLTQ